MITPSKKRKEGKEEPMSEKKLTKVSVLSLLRANDNCDIINVLADKYYKEQDSRKCYELIKK